MKLFACSAFFVLAYGALSFSQFPQEITHLIFHHIRSNVRKGQCLDGPVSTVCKEFNQNLGACFYLKHERGLELLFEVMSGGSKAKLLVDLAFGMNSCQALPKQVRLSIYGKLARRLSTECIEDLDNLFKKSPKIDISDVKSDALFGAFWDRVDPEFYFREDSDLTRDERLSLGARITELVTDDSRGMLKCLRLCYQLPPDSRWGGILSPRGDMRVVDFGILRQLRSDYDRYAEYIDARGAEHGSRQTISVQFRKNRLLALLAGYAEPVSPGRMLELMKSFEVSHLVFADLVLREGTVGDCNLHEACRRSSLATLLKLMSWEEVSKVLKHTEHLSTLIKHDGGYSRILPYEHQSHLILEALLPWAIDKLSLYSDNVTRGDCVSLFVGMRNGWNFDKCLDYMDKSFRDARDNDLGGGAGCALL